MQTEERPGDLFELDFRIPAGLGFLLENGGREGGGRVDTERGLRERRLDAWLEAAVDVANDGLKIVLEQKD